MKKFFLSGVILIIFLLFLVTTSSAITIGFDPISQTVPVGNTAEVALVIEGLGNGSEPSVSIFDLKVNFDSAILDFDSVVFGDPVLGDQLDLLGLGSDTSFDDTVAGSVNLFELSSDWPLDLDIFQAGNFTLATLTFNTLAVGFSPLEISIIALGDSWGDPLSATVENGSISPVPEPATILLLVSGMAGLGVFGRKKIGSSKA
jgi:hypothetical protein